MKAGSPRKRVNVISIEIRNENMEVISQGGIIMRTTRSYAEKLLAQGTHTFTSKGKLKSYLNKSLKLWHNKEYLSQFDMADKKLGHKMIKDEFSGRTYVLFKRKEKDVFVESKTGEINPLTGKILSHKIRVPVFQAFIASYPD
jgi:hypothetical protein